MADIVYKVGDEVVIINMFANGTEWLRYVRSLPGRKQDSYVSMTSVMIDRYGGKPAKIAGCRVLGDRSIVYTIDIDAGTYTWSQYMFEEHYDVIRIDTVGIEGLI